MRIDVSFYCCSHSHQWQPGPPQSVTVTVISSGSLQTLWPPSFIKLLIMSSVITAKCCGGSLCAPLIAWDIKRLRWYTHLGLHGGLSKAGPAGGEHRLQQTVLINHAVLKLSQLSSYVCRCAPGVLTRWAFLLVEAEWRTTRSTDEWWRRGGLVWGKNETSFIQNSVIWRELGPDFLKTSNHVAATMRPACELHSFVR